MASRLHQPTERPHYDLTIAVSTYTRWVRRYALRGLVAHLLVKERSRGDARAEDEALAAELLRGEGDSNDDGSGDAGWWPYRRGLLQTEFASGDGVQDLFEELLATEQAVADAVEASKRRDDVRGEGIIDDYAAAREPLEGDKVIKRAREEATLVARAVDRLRRSPVVSLPLEALV